MREEQDHPLSGHLRRLDDEEAEHLRKTALTVKQEHLLALPESTPSQSRHQNGKTLGLFERIRERKHLRELKEQRQSQALQQNAIIEKGYTHALQTTVEGALQAHQSQIDAQVEIARCRAEQEVKVACIRTKEASQAELDAIRLVAAQHKLIKQAQSDALLVLAASQNQMAVQNLVKSFETHLAHLKHNTTDPVLFEFVSEREYAKFVQRLDELKDATLS